jgi:hypothetical protein
MAFNTAHGTIRGGLADSGMINNDADAIFVEGDTVSFFKSGVDFPAELLPEDSEGSGRVA